jgi:hypothetical protein
MTGKKSRFKRLPPIISIFIMILASGAGCETEVEMSESDVVKKTWHSGRFSFELPDAFKKTRSEYTLYGPEIKTIPVDPENADAAELWNKRLEEIRKKKQPPEGIKDVIIRKLEIQPGWPGVFYYGRYYSKRIVTLEVQKMFDGHLLNLKYQGIIKKGENMIKLTNNVGQTYLPFSGPPPTDKPAFCVGQGYLSIKPSRRKEITAIKFKNKKLGAEVEVSTKLIGKVIPDNAPFNDFNNRDIQELIESAGEVDVTVKILHKGSAKAGHFKGKTMALSFADETGPDLQFTWFYPGVPGSAGSPEITIVLDGSEPKHKKELMKIWEDLLASFQPVGMIEGDK